ncbi:MAG: hypothetical protein NTX51_00095, partial [Verrucomicrobia bacterium]|nr:hypothetical protein [Verrucomicrobiota bacterium]
SLVLGQQPKISNRALYSKRFGAIQARLRDEWWQGRNSCYRSADILVRLGLANAVEADKNVRAPFAFLHVVGNCELRPGGNTCNRAQILPVRAFSRP